MKLLLSSGGTYELASGQDGPGKWRYSGGETRLISLARTTSFGHFIHQLSKATAAVWDQVRVQQAAGTAVCSRCTRQWVLQGHHWHCRMQLKDARSSSAAPLAGAGDAARGAAPRRCQHPNRL